MLTLEQVRALEARVEKAVNLIAALRAENGTLRSGLAAAEGRVAELEGLVREFQADQARIEEGIVHALKKLDAFEDVVHAAGVAADQAAAQAQAHANEAPEPPSGEGDAVPPAADEAAPDGAAGSVEAGDAEAGSPEAEAAGEAGGDLDIF